jgi:valyl-tRNA synthetase
MEWVVAAISEVRAARTEWNVPPAARVPLFVKDAEPVVADRLQRHREHFIRLARVEEIEAVKDMPVGGIQIVVEGATLILRPGGVIDLTREKARLEREIARLNAEIDKIAAKLANPGFLAKAPPDIVEEQREREVEARRDRDRRLVAYGRLEGAARVTSGARGALSVPRPD